MQNRIVKLCLLLLATWAADVRAQICPDTVALSMTTEYVGQQLEVTIRVVNFKKMTAFQFGFNYDADVFSFQDASSMLPSFGANAYMDNGKGNIRFVWIDNNLDGTSLVDGEKMITLRFKILQTASESFLEISKTQLPIEFVNNDGEVLCVKTDLIQASSKGTRVWGLVTVDADGDCSYSAGDKGLAGWVVELSQGAQKYYRTTDASGRYAIALPAGTYTARLISRNDVWSVCDDRITVVATGDEVGLQSFVVKAKVACPQMVVDVVTPALQRCAENTYVISYENQGSAVAENAKVELTFDEDLSFVKTSAPNFIVSQGKVVFDIGEVAVGQKSSFRLVLNLACTTTLTGQTHCVSATVFPNDLCIPAVGWTGANLRLEATCDETQNSVIFTLFNAGTGDMSSARTYIVTEDDVMTPPQPVMLDAQEEVTISLPADGTTYRLTAGQDTNYPFASLFTTLAVEGCGDDGSGAFTTGFVTQFEESDRDVFTDRECRESTTSRQPNQIIGLHKGYGPDKLIQRDAHLEYTICLQNTGFDTALAVLVKNPLAAELDLTTLQMGASSHPYTYRINQQRELVVRLENIMLPDSLTDKEGSTAFFRYTISPVEDVADGTRIENRAFVYFDYTDPAMTVPEFHTLGSNFVMTSVAWVGDPAGVRFYPNPVQKDIILDFSASGAEVAEYSVTDLQGRVLIGGTVYNSVYTIPCDHFPPGQYFVRVAFKDGRIASWMLIKR